MKILKMQAGAQIPFVDYIPVTQNILSGQGAQTRASSSDKKSENLLEKAALKAVEENGLDVDVNIFAEYATQLMQSNALGIGDFTSSVSQLMKLRKVANQLRISKQLYDKAIDHTRTNNTGDDFAMTSDGKIYVAKIDGDKISLDTVKLETLAENQENYQPLTNNQLLDIRNNGHYNNIPLKENVAFNESILRDVNTSIGMQDVLTNITNIISKFGRRKSESYPNLSQSVANGMEYLYKVSTEYSNAFQDVAEDGETKKDVSAAIRYILTGLNNNAKNTLRLHAELNGTTVENFIKEAIVFNTDVSYSEDLEKAPKGKGSGGKEQLGSESWEHSVFKGHGRPQMTGMTLEGRTRFVFPGIRFDSIKGPDGKDTKPVVSGLEAFNNLQNRGLVATGQPAYFGNIPLDNISGQGMDLIVDNSSGLMVTYLPTDKSGNPDFSMMQQMSKVQELIDNDRITDPEKKAQYWEKYGFKYDKIRDTGVPHDRKMRPFLVQNAYTTEATDSFADTWKGASPLYGNNFFEKVDASVVDRLLQQYNSTAQKGEKLDWNSGWLTDSYRSTIYIPMNDNELQSMISGGEAYSPKVNINLIGAQQDATRLTGGYDYNTGSYDQTLKGTTDDDLN